MKNEPTESNTYAKEDDGSKVHSSRPTHEEIQIKEIDSLPSVRSYLSRVNGKASSIDRARVSEFESGYARSIATLKFAHEPTENDPPVTVQLQPGSGWKEKDLAPTEAEADALRRDLNSVRWPTYRPLMNGYLPKENQTHGSHLYYFYEQDGKQKRTSMVRERIERDDGTKLFKTWTYWSDGEWRNAEPPGKLPLYNGDNLKNAHRVFIHEGEKAGEQARRIADPDTDSIPLTREERAELRKHPFHELFKTGVHVGFPSGAAHPERTDYSSINMLGECEVIIVADNDTIGRQAAGRIAYIIRKRTKMLQLTAAFPQGFDCGDPIPKKMFAPAPSGTDGEQVYIGPQAEQMLVPITCATDLVPNPSGKGRPIIQLRQHVKKSVVHITESDHFISDEQPDKILSRGEFDREMAARSHTPNLSKIVEREFNGRTCSIAYEPGRPPGIIEQDGGMAMNTFRGTSLRPQSGDVQPLLEYMAYMFPNEAEFEEVLRWCATLIGRPHIRMAYALLLISKTQGIGKTTLAEQLLRPLVGAHNCSVVTDTQLVDSQFNAWLGSKRLIIVNEIYSGQGWKAYNKSKTIITDEFVEVNQKHEKPYTVKNYSHVFACSNSDRAIRVAEEDRRWFIPTLAEGKWPRKKFAALRNFLERGGLSHILYWAQYFESLSGLKFVAPGAAAPMTERKRRMIEDSRSPLVNLAVELAETISDPSGEYAHKPVALVGAHIMEWLKNHPENDAKGSGTVRNDEVSVAMASVGLRRFGDRPKWKDRRTFILMNPALTERVGLAQIPKERRKMVEEFVRAPHEILPNSL